MPYKTYQNKQGAAANSPGMAAPEMNYQGMMGNNAYGTQPADGNGMKKMFPQKFAGIAKPKPIPNAIRKKRSNYRLRKIIVPKAPLMVLNEMVGAVTYTFADSPPMSVHPSIPNLHTAQCVIEDQTFTGTGPSKQISKNICAENAIRAIVSKKCADPKNRQQVDSEGNPLKPNQMEDETPWAQLASLALFKLFNDWQAEGYKLPQELLRSPSDSEGKSASVTPAATPTPEKNKAKKMPDNPTERHPVQLLNELQGAVTYMAQETAATTGNGATFTMTVEIDGIPYSGEGRNKKDAKRNCAMTALKQLHGIIYPVTPSA